jgi:hypothetical protein
MWMMRMRLKRPKIVLVESGGGRRWWTNLICATFSARTIPVCFDFASQFSRTGTTLTYYKDSRDDYVLISRSYVSNVSVFTVYSMVSGNKSETSSAL